MTELHLEVGAHRIAGLRRGRGGGPRVLALHGWLDNAASVEPLAPLLPDLDLVAVDLPGHGHSSWLPEGCRYHFVDMVPVLAGILDALEWDEASLLGHSMGGGAAVLAAATLPKRVRRLVLLEALGPLSDPAEETPGRLARAVSASPPSSPRPRPNLEAAIKARLRGSDLDEASARLLVERGTEGGPEGVRFTHDPRLKEPSLVRFTEGQVLACLAAIEAETLVVLDDGGWLDRRPEASGRLDALRRAEVVRLGGGHHLHMTRPDDIAAVVGPFLRRA